MRFINMLFMAVSRQRSFLTAFSSWGSGAFIVVINHKLAGMVVVVVGPSHFMCSFVWIRILELHPTLLNRCSKLNSCILYEGKTFKLSSEAEFLLASDLFRIKMEAKTKVVSVSRIW